MSVPFRHPSTILVSGPTQSGKTRFVYRLLDNIETMFDPPPRRVVYCYGEHQPGFDRYEKRGVTFRSGLPDVDEFDGRQPALVVIDDLMQELDESVVNLFTKGSHHRDLTVVFVVQNLFHKSPHLRTVSLNSHYLVLFKSPRDAGQIVVLARQMYPGQSAFAVEAFKDATTEPYSYLVLDLRPEQSEELRLRTNVFPDDPVHYVYVPKKKKK